MKINVRRLPDRYNDDTIGISLEIDPEMLRKLKMELDSTLDYDSSNQSYMGLLLYNIIHAATHPQR